MRKPVLLEGVVTWKKVVTKDDQDQKKKFFFFDLRQSSQVVSDMLGEVTTGVAAEKNFLVLTTSETHLG